MSEDKNPHLIDHFERLKAILPEVYLPVKNDPKYTNDTMFSLLKNSLGVIEAVYLQSPESFSNTQLDVYSNIISQMEEMGIEYKGNKEILNKAANQLIMQAKKPMEKAGLVSRADLGRKTG